MENEGGSPAFIYIYGSVSRSNLLSTPFLKCRSASTATVSPGYFQCFKPFCRTLSSVSIRREEGLAGEAFEIEISALSKIISHIPIVSRCYVWNKGCLLLLDKEWGKWKVRLLLNTAVTKTSWGDQWVEHNLSWKWMNMKMYQLIDMRPPAAFTYLHCGCTIHKYHCPFSFANVI